MSPREQVKRDVLTGIHTAFMLVKRGLDNNDFSEEQAEMWIDADLGGDVAFLWRVWLREAKARL